MTLVFAFDRWIVGVIRFQKIFGLYGLKHQIVEISGDVRIVISALWVKTNSQIMDTILWRTVTKIRRQRGHP